MAGFVNRGDSIGQGNIFSRLKGPLRKLAEVGMKLDDKIIKNKIGIGPHEANAIATKGDEQSIYFAALSDINTKRAFTAYDEKDYVQRRDYLRGVSLHSDLDDILDIISDEAIVFDDQNFFAKPNIELIDGFKDKFEEELKLKIEENFAYIYNRVFEFNDSTVARRYFKKWLVDGYLAFELVYNDKQTRIEKAILLDVAQLKADVIFNNGLPVRVWVLYPDDSRNMRIIPDTNIIHVSYSKDGFSSRISYLEKLIRTFNLKRTVENSTLIWFLMNATYRLKIVVPSGGSPQRNAQLVGETISKFKEEITIDDSSGEVRIDGTVGLNLSRNYVMTAKDGQSVEISSLKFDGPDLSNPDILKYWDLKLKKESRIPLNRFDTEGSTEINIGTDAKGQSREEKRFDNFLISLRSDFQEILKKPLLMQTLLDYPQYKSDAGFAAKIGIKYVENNMYREATDMEMMKQRITNIKEFVGLTEKDAEGNEVPWYPMELLIKKYLGLPQTEIKEIEDWKKKHAKPTTPGDSATEPTEEAPAEEAPTEEAPAEEAPTEEAPAEEPTE